MRIATGSFGRHVLTLIGGSALAQLLPLLATPFLTRLYSPEQFGALALLLAVANPVSLLVCGRYELTVVLPKEDREARTLVQVALLFALGSLIVLGGLTWSLAPAIAGWTSDGGRDAWQAIVLAPVLFLLMGTFQPLNHWLLRKQAFRAVSVNKVAQTTAITALSLGLGLVAVNTGLMWAYIGGWAVHLLVAFVQSGYKGLHLRPIDMSAVRELARRYRHYPIFNALPAVLNTATLSIPVFLLTRHFDEEVTGQFNLCRQAVFLPTLFIASAFLQVYTQRAGAAVANGEPVVPGLRRTLRLLAPMALAVAAVLLTLGPWLFALVFGAEWEPAGRFARLLALPIAAQFVVVPLAVLLNALGRIRQYSIWQVAYFAAVLGCSWLPFQGPETYLTILAAVDVLAFGALGLMIARGAVAHDRSLYIPLA